ncbi:hypothetical protein [Streptomyces sp. SD15]
MPTTPDAPQAKAPGALLLCRKRPESVGPGPGAGALAAGQLAAGVPLTVWGVRRRSAGWVVVGTVLMVRGVLGLAYDRLRAFD